MENLDLALSVLKKTQEKFSLPGLFEQESNFDAKWPLSLPCSIDLRQFFQVCSPVNVKFDTGFSRMTFLNLDAIEKGQFGYRWYGSNLDSLNPLWPESYVVFIDRVGGGKPIIAVTDKENTSVYANYDVGKPFKISDTFADFILALCKMIDIVYGEYDVYDLVDDDGVSENFSAKLSLELIPIIGKKNFDNFYDYFYG